MKYKVVVHAEVEVEADNEEQATTRFFEREVYDVQSDPGSWIEGHMEVTKG